MDIAEDLITTADGLAEAGRTAAALSGYEHARELAANVPTALRTYGRAAIGQAHALRTLGRIPEALLVTNEALGRLQAAAERADDVIVGLHYEKLRALSESGDTAAKVAEAQTLIRGFRDHADPEVRLAVAYAFAMIMALSMDSGSNEAAITASDELLAFIGAPASEEWRLKSARALIERGTALARQARWPEALESATAAVSYTVGVGSRRERRLAVEARTNESRARRELADKAGAAATLEHIAGIGGEDPEPYIESLVRAGLLHRTQLLRELGQYDAAIDASDELLTRVRPDQSNRAAIVRVEALQARLEALAPIGRYDEIIQAHTEIVEQDTEQDTWLAQRAVLAVVAKTMMMDQHGLPIDDSERRIMRERASLALDAYTETIQSANRDGTQPALETAAALYSRAWLLINVGEPKRAAGSLDEISRRFAASDDPTLQALVEQAESLRSRAFGDHG